MKRNVTVGLFATLAIAACADDGTGVEGDAMTRAEATALASAIALSSEGATAEGLAEVTQSGGDGAGTITFTRTATHPCPQGGEVAVELNATVDYDEQAQSFDLDADGILTHDGCSFEHEGERFTVDGDPGLSLEAHAAAEGGEPVGDWTSSVVGAFLWTADDGRDGRCVIDLSTITDFTATNRSVSGEVCGHTIQQTIDWNE